MTLLYWLSWFILLATPAKSAVSQDSTSTTFVPYQALPTKPLLPVNDSGVFIWPVTSSVQSFPAGSMMNITWETKLSKVNLWLVPNYDWNSPCNLVSNTGQMYFEWTVTCDEGCMTDCRVPWLVRVTDAAGSAKEQNDGGFVSALFWISGEDIDASSTSSTLSVSSVVTTISMSTETESPTSSVQTSAHSHPAVSLSQAAGAIPPTASATASFASTGDEGTTTNIAIGVGVGAGVVVLALVAGLFLLLRRHYRSKNNGRPASPTINTQYSTSRPLSDSFSAKQPHAQVALSELPSEALRAYTQYHEAPPWNQEPQELHAGTPVLSSFKQGYR